MCNRVLAMSAWQGWHCGAGGRLIFSRELDHSFLCASSGMRVSKVWSAGMAVVALPIFIGALCVIHAAKTA